jgi:hypothetical protein
MFGKVVLLGRGTGGEEYVRKLFTHQVWACFSAVQTFHSRIDLAFGADPLEILDKTVNGKSNPAMVSVVKYEVERRKIPIYLPRIYDGWPTCRKFPLREIVKKFGITYFSNTICYMVAYAIYTGVKQLDLYGINMSFGSEYTEEKGGLEFWLGYAMGKGIKVNVHGESSQVLKTASGKLYGYGCDKKLKGGIV